MDASFLPHLESRDADWQQHNDSQVKVRHDHDPSRRPCLIIQLQAVQLLNIGVNMAFKHCVRSYDSQLGVSCKFEECEGWSRSKVNMAIFVNDIRRILLEAKSPTVMERIRNRLPLHGMKLR